MRHGSIWCEARSRASKGVPHLALRAGSERGASRRVVDLNPAQRQAMIRGMVERLAERLRRDGSDVEGWLRLVRSYMVLGEPDKARAAVDDARRALAGDPTKLRANRRPGREDGS